MATTKIKGICKGSFKYLSHLFEVKEREMEIGLPTDVKHVAHIGWNGPDSTPPTWMNDFKSSLDMAMTTPVGSNGGSRDLTWSSQGTHLQNFEQAFGRQPSSARMMNFPPGNTPITPQKHKRKKTRSSSSTPKTSSARSSRSSKPHKSMLCDSEERDVRNSLRA